MYGSTVFLYCFNTINCFIHKLAHFPTKSKKMIAPENRPKTHYLVKFAGQKQTNYICPGNFQKKQLFFVNFRGKQFYLNFKLFCPAKLPGQTMPRKCPAT